MEPEYKNTVWAVETAINLFMKKKKKRHSSKKIFIQMLAEFVDRVLLKANDNTFVLIFIFLNVYKVSLPTVKQNFPDVFTVS